MFVQLRHRLAVLNRVFDELFYGVEVGVANCSQLNRWQIEVVLDAVLDPHRHQRIQSQLDQRHFPREILGLVAHRAADDRRQSVVHGLRGVRGPLAEAATHAGAGGESVVQDVGVVGSRDLHLLSDRRAHRNTGGDRGGQGRRHAGPGHYRVVDQRERLVDTSVYLHRGATGVAGQGGHQPGTLTWDRALLRGRH